MRKPEPCPAASVATAGRWSETSRSAVEGKGRLVQVKESAIKLSAPVTLVTLVNSNLLPIRICAIRSIHTHALHDKLLGLLGLTHAKWFYSIDLDRPY